MNLTEVINSENYKQYSNYIASIVTSYDPPPEFANKLENITDPKIKAAFNTGISLDLWVDSVKKNQKYFKISSIVLFCLLLFIVIIYLALIFSDNNTWVKHHINETLGIIIVLFILFGIWIFVGDNLVYKLALPKYKKWESNVKTFLATFPPPESTEILA